MSRRVPAAIVTTRRRAAIAIFVGGLAGLVGVPLPSLAAGRACAAGQTHVAVVVDFGGVAATTATCVAADARDNGATALAARASQLGRAAPRFGSTGLLCAIDGIPARGCGAADGKQYAYWSYWHGSGGQWSYANVGPAGSRVAETVVEGWRWQPNGAGNPTDPPPRGSARAGAICVTGTGGSPTPTSVASPPPTQPRRGAPDPTVIPLGPGANGATRPPTTPPSASNASGSPTTAGPPSTESGASSKFAGDDLAAASGRGGSGGAPVGLIAGVVLVAALGVGGVIVARRRRRPAS